MSFEKVFEIAPIFRAEPSRTNRHLAEAISIDLEEAFVDYNDVMNRIEEIIKISITTVKNYSNENKDTEFAIPEIPEKIPQKLNGVMIFIPQISKKSDWRDFTLSKTGH
jgi:aspartyl-tRNA synthetase